MYGMLEHEGDPNLRAGAQNTGAYAGGVALKHQCRAALTCRHVL